MGRATAPRDRCSSFRRPSFSRCSASYCVLFFASCGTVIEHEHGAVAPDSPDAGSLQPRDLYHAHLILETFPFNQVRHGAFCALLWQRVELVDTSKSFVGLTFSHCSLSYASCSFIRCIDSATHYIQVMEETHLPRDSSLPPRKVSSSAPGVQPRQQCLTSSKGPPPLSGPLVCWPSSVHD